MFSEVAQERIPSLLLGFTLDEVPQVNSLEDCLQIRQYFYRVRLKEINLCDVGVLLRAGVL
jgi:hypothetical protein